MLQVSHTSEEISARTEQTGLGEQNEVSFFVFKVAVMTLKKFKIDEDKVCLCRNFLSFEQFRQRQI